MVFFFISKSLSEIRLFLCEEKICRQLRQLRPETGESLAIFYIANQIILPLFSSVWFYFLYQNSIKVNIFLMWGKIYFGHWGRYSLKRGHPFRKFWITNQTEYVVLLLLLPGSSEMENIPVDSIQLGTNFHGDVDDCYTISSKIQSNEIVVITLSNRKRYIQTWKNTCVAEKSKNPNWVKRKIKLEKYIITREGWWRHIWKIW